jgi:hypothetical protein
MHKEPSEHEPRLENPPGPERPFDGPDGQNRARTAAEWKGYSPEILDLLLDP